MKVKEEPTETSFSVALNQLTMEGKVFAYMNIYGTPEQIQKAFEAIKDTGCITSGPSAPCKTSPMTGGWVNA